MRRGWGEAAETGGDWWNGLPFKSVSRGLRRRVSWWPSGQAWCWRRGGRSSPPPRHAPVGPRAPGEQPRLSCPSWGDGAATAGLCAWRPREGLNPACCPLPPPGGGSPRGPPAPGWGSLGWGAACSPGWPGSSSRPVSQTGHSCGFKDTVKGISKSVYNVVMCGLTEFNDEFRSVAVLRNCLNNDSELPR